MPVDPLDELPRNLRSRSMLSGQAASAAAEVEAALAPVPQPQVGAFFDVDNTIMQGASIFLLARGLIRHGFIKPRDLARFAGQQFRFRMFGEDDGQIDEARDQALSVIAGHSVATLEELGEEIFDEYMAMRIWPGTRALTQWHLDQGHRVWLVTAAPLEVARVIARRLGLTGALGTIAEQSDGVYTGRLVGGMLHGAAKGEAVRALAEREGLDLSRCFAYSDAANDLPMLTLVGHPCAINPDGALADHAREQGWTIRDYRTGRRAAAAGLKLTAGGVAAGVGWWAVRSARR